MAAALSSSPSHPAELTNWLQTVTSSLPSCSSLKQAKQIHACIIRNDLPQYLYAKLLLLCTKSQFPSTSAFDNAMLVFEQQLSQEPTCFMWNTMIRYYAGTGSPNQAVSAYTRMRVRGMLPNNYTFTFLIKACSADSSLCLLGRAVHAQSVVFGIPDSDVHVYTSLVNMYASAAQGNVEAARSLFDKMQYRTAATWNAMIAGYARKGDIEAAEELFNKMPEKDEQSWNVMVCGYSKIGKFDDACRLFQGMPTKTLPTWNAMISSYVLASMPAEALALFHRMQLTGLRPDRITVISVLPACAQLGALESGEWIHFYVERNGLDGDTTVCNALIDMYSKCGCIDKAMAVFKGMIERSLVSWNTIISGLAINGRGKEAIELFKEMESGGMMPDDITFVGLLNACAHTGLVDKAWSYFTKMQNVYGVQPQIRHYGCMVDILGRAHRLEEALKLIDKMPIEPNSVILGSLLGACRICNDFQLGEKILEKLVDLEPQNPGYYVLLSNMYAAVGRWEEVIRIRNLMKSQGISKTPGCSSIEVDNTIHEFVVGDKNHPQSKQIHAKLDEMNKKLDLVGYVPDTSVVLFDLDEEEKARNLSVHSEKLAVAFGLLNINHQKPIRVVKNLRICKDCHSAINIISHIYDREIVLRDCNRFHHFKDGQCSCNDFW